MTEEEAKTKWCPHARVGSAISGLGAMNSDFREGPVPEAYCRGSECMAWRWEFGPKESKRMGTPPSGYCGLAGKP